MPTGLTGGAGMAEIIAGLQDCASAEWRNDLTQIVGNEVLAETLDTFPRQASPTGIRWKPSRRALREGGFTLVDTGKMRSQYRMSFTPMHVTITNASTYVQYHQDGTRKMVRRPMLPDPNAPLPPGWERSMDAGATDLIERTLAKP